MLLRKFWMIYFRSPHYSECGCDSQFVCAAL